MAAAALRTEVGLGASGASASGSSFDLASEMLARPSVMSTTMHRPMSPPWSVRPRTGEESRGFAGARCRAAAHGPEAG